MPTFPRGTYRARSTEFVVRLGSLSDDLLALLDRITRARTIIEQAELLPAHEGEMRRSATIVTVHLSTQIEGNPLPTSAAADAVGGRLEPTTRDARELVNYVRALDWIDRAATSGALSYSTDLILELHQVLTDGLGSDEPDEYGHTFRPEREGAWRDGVVQIPDPLGQVQFVGPHPDDVPALMEDYCTALERQRTKPPAVLAGIAHWGLTDIHPFADGNGRMARLLTVLVLMREGFLRRRLFSFERYYARDRDAYFEALRLPGSMGPLNDWLGYFLSGLVSSYEEAAQNVLDLETVARQLPASVQLRPIESRVLLDLVERRQFEFTRADFQEVGQCSEKTAKQSLRRLVEAEVVQRTGAGPSTAYTFAREASSGQRTRQRKWTDARIREQLEAFVGERPDFPSVREFKAAGLQQLYEAIARYGGAETWARELGLARATRRGGRPAAPRAPTG